MTNEPCKYCGCRSITGLSEGDLQTRQVFLCLMCIVPPTYARPAVVATAFLSMQYISY
ncbi:protein of unknown function [Candidatus Filomicrobium marinum]|uniref:Uncharacterized protein n=1 Tax=Candidatus Filomicrobium marinum TaxID=1608628 RepID=A0A0D6JKN2_9HYPH|nr:protein of unknown function [Candidatus Filomicrobium marinum]CPR22220.1 protein of unknown function [Candidatus Filomicrobium marinum]